MENITSRKQAIAAGAKHFYTGRPCKNGHLDLRFTSDGKCVSCNREKVRSYYAKHPELKREVNDRLRSKDPERFAELARERNRRYVNSMDECRRQRKNAKLREWRYCRTDSMIQRDREKRSQYIKNRSDLFAFYASSRNKMRRMATPAWISDKQKAEIASLYRKSKEMSAATGIPHNVDHIVPITSDIVCGLHVPWNMRVITRRENISKLNRYWPDMP